MVIKTMPLVFFDEWAYVCNEGMLNAFLPVNHPCLSFV